MPEGGCLTIATGLANGFVELSVSDTGQGIAPEHLDNIFQLYFTTKKNGSGVGLPLAMRAVDLHGGSLDIDSRLNEGTAVRIRLPVEGRALRSGASVSAD
jgi:signal transduction histidine kinase